MVNITCIVQHRTGAQLTVGTTVTNTAVSMSKKMGACIFHPRYNGIYSGIKAFELLDNSFLNPELTGWTGPWANGIWALKFCHQKIHWLPWKKGLTDSKEATHMGWGNNSSGQNKVVNKVILQKYQKQKGREVIGNI